MARLKVTRIKESVEELRSYRSSVDSYQGSKKLNFLLLFSEFPNISVAEASVQIGIGTSTVTRWFHAYKDLGVLGFLAIPKRKRTSKFITPQIHSALEKRLQAAKASFSGYKDAQQWVEQEFEVTIAYHILRRYMINKLDARLKIPRKSNVKKDPEASAEFFKTT